MGKKSDEKFIENWPIFMAREHVGKIKQYDSVLSLVLIFTDLSQTFNSIGDKVWRVHNF